MMGPCLRYDSGFMTTSSSPIATGRVRLAFLDGLRGLAALYVVFYHVYHPLAHYGPLQFPVNLLISWAAAGRYAVAVFIVLSGFVLMLPVTRSSTGELKGGVRGFLMRRARRILPPYFAALIASVVAVAAVEPLLRDPALYGFSLLPVFDTGSLFSHFVLLHNLNRAWIFTINSALWSVATEWQIYLLFAFLLHPLSRRVPIWSLVPFGFALGIALHGLAGIDTSATLWFLGLFALGMLASDVAFGRARTFAAFPWRAVGLLALTVFVGLFVIEHSVILRLPLGPAYVTLILDTLIGVATTCFIVVASHSRALAAPLERPVFQKLGAFSYSLYLMHFPVLAVADAVLRRAGVSQLTHFAGLLLLGVPIAIVLSLLLYWFTERPFSAHAK
jgi:peptidoglycan/LPS O-acetylase OafA/YrhL